jgi:16S rRNA (guanine527-N7)-methyltransferase
MVLTDNSLLSKYFPELSQDIIEKFSQAAILYKSWNEKINVISRKDIDQIFLHHFLHSLSIAKFISFKKGTRVIDIGTGGGLPGIPLAIIFPETEFLLVDSIGKKITVIDEIAKGLQLKNITAIKSRAEDLKVKCDFVISRAVAPITEICDWTRSLITPGGKNALKNGWIFLKGGDLREEIQLSKLPVIETDIEVFFHEDYFKEKKIIYISKN